MTAFSRTTSSSHPSQRTPRIRAFLARAGTSSPPSIRTGVAVLASALLFAGCGGNLTPGGFGEVEVSVSADAPDAMVLPAPALARSIVARDDDIEEPEGKLEIEFILSLIDDRGEVIPVDDKEIEVELDLAGFFEADAVRAVMPARRYVGLRVDFTEIEVEVDRGVIIDGVPIQGRIEIELEDDEVVTVERPLDIVLPEGGRIHVLLDLNTRTWLRAIDPDLRTVAERIFADAIRVVVQ
jgi:hypothetical protein